MPTRGLLASGVIGWGQWVGLWDGAPLLPFKWASVYPRYVALKYWSPNCCFSILIKGQGFPGIHLVQHILRTSRSFSHVYLVISCHGRTWIECLLCEFNVNTVDCILEPTECVLLNVKDVGLCCEEKWCWFARLNLPMDLVHLQRWYSLKVIINLIMDSAFVRWIQKYGEWS